MAATDMIYDDSDFAQIASIRPTAAHRHVDNTIFEADEEGKCTSRVHATAVN